MMQSFCDHVHLFGLKNLTLLALQKKILRVHEGRDGAKDRELRSCQEF